MGNKLGSQKSTAKSKGDKKREQEEKKLQKKEQKAKKKSTKKSIKKHARGGFQNSESEIDDTDLESSHFTGADSESGVFHSAENLSTSPYLDSCTRSERENSGMWGASSSAASQHPQVLSSRDFRDGFSLEACIPPEIARPVTHYTDTTSCSGGGGGGAGSDYTIGYRCYNNSSGSLRSKRSNSVKSHGHTAQHHTPTFSRQHKDDVMSVSTSSSQKSSSHTGTGGYCTPLLNTPVFGRADRSVSPHSGLSLSRVHEPDRDSMDIVPLPYSTFDPSAKVYTTYNPTIITNKTQQQQPHHHQQQQHHHYFHQPIDYRNLPKPTSPHPQRRAFSPKMTSAPFKIISSDESSSSPTTPIPQRKAAALLSDLFRTSKKKSKKSASEDEEKSSSSHVRKVKERSNDEEHQGTKSKKTPIWKTWERSNKRKSSNRESKLSIFGTSRKTEKKKREKAESSSKDKKKDRSSDSTLQDFKIDNGDDNGINKNHDDPTERLSNAATTTTATSSTTTTTQQKTVPEMCNTTKSSTSSFDNSSRGTCDIDFSLEKNRNSSPPVAKSAAFCIMRLEELERNIEKTIKEKFPDADPFLLRRTPPEDVSRGSKSLPTTPSLKKKLYVTRGMDFTSDDVTPTDLDRLSAKLESIKGATRYYNETFEDSYTRAKSPVIVRRFGARTRHASISPKILRAKTAAIYNSPSEMERMAESKEEISENQKEKNKRKEDKTTNGGGNSSQQQAKSKTPVLVRKMINTTSTSKSETTAKDMSSSKQNDKTNVINTAKQKNHIRPLVRQQRVEEPEKEEKNQKKDDKYEEKSHPVDEQVVVSTDSAVFGSVSPKLKRQLKDNNNIDKSKPLSTKGKQTNQNGSGSIKKRGGEGLSKNQAVIKRRSGSLDSLLDAAARSSGPDGQLGFQKQSREKDKQNQEFVHIKPLDKSPTNKRVSPTASSVSVRSRIKSINKSLSEDVVGYNNQGRKNSGGGGGSEGNIDNKSAQLSSPASSAIGEGMSAPAINAKDERNQTSSRLGGGSHVSNTDSKQQSKGERINRSNVAGLGVSPNLARKHSADHVIFGSAVALPCRVYASASTTTESCLSGKAVTSPTLSRGSKEGKRHSPPLTHAQNSVRETKNAKNQECQDTKVLELERVTEKAGRESGLDESNGDRNNYNKSIGTSETEGAATRCRRQDGGVTPDRRGKEGGAKMCVGNDKQLAVSDYVGYKTTHFENTGSSEDSVLKPEGEQLSFVCDDRGVREASERNESGRSILSKSSDVFPYSLSSEYRDSSSKVLTTRSLNDVGVFGDNGGDDSDNVILGNDNGDENRSDERAYVKVHRNGNAVLTEDCNHSNTNRQNHATNVNHQQHHHLKKEEFVKDHIQHQHHYEQQQQLHHRSSFENNSYQEEAEQPFVVLKQPISKVISDMINVSKQQQQQQQQPPPLQQQQHQQQQQQQPQQHPHHPHHLHQQEQDQQQPSQETPFHHQQSTPRQSSPTTPDKDALVVEPAVAMVTTPSFEQPLTTLEEGTVIRESNTYSKKEQHYSDEFEKDLDATFSSEEKDVYISSEGTGESDLERFIQSVKESEKPSSSDGKDFQELGESPKETSKHQPPPPSPNALEKLLAEFAEEDEEEDDNDDDGYYQRLERQENQREVNLALTRQVEIKEFTDKVINRLSDLLGSHSGNEVNDDDDEVFIDNTRDDPLVEGASYRVVRREDDDANEDETCSFFDNGESVDNNDLVRDDYVLSSSTKDPIPAERIKPSRFSTSSSLSTSSSSSSSSGLFAPPPPASSSMRAYDGIEGAPKLSPKPDFFIFPDRLEDVEDINSGYPNEASQSRSAQTRSYHSDDDVARGGGIPEYYDDRPLWNRRQKPPGQISAKMASIRRRERRERWLKKRRRNKTDLLSTCSSELGSEQSLNKDQSLLSLNDFEEDEEVAKLSSQRGAMGSGILTSPKYTKPILPFLVGRGDNRSPEPAEEELTSRTVSSSILQASVTHRRFYGDDYYNSKPSSQAKNNEDSDLGYYEPPGQEIVGGKEDSDTVSDRGQISSRSNTQASMKIPGLEETFDELVSVQQLLEGLQERAPASETTPHSKNATRATDSARAAKFMPLTVENIRSMKDQFRDNNSNGRQSRLSNTNRTESDLDIYSEYRDDASTDSNLYADDEDDDDVNDPYTTADDELSDATGGTADVDNFVVSCTFYNSNTFQEPPSRPQDVISSGFAITATGTAVTETTLVDANRLSTPVSSVRNSTEEEFKLPSLGDVFTNTSLRPQPAMDVNTRSFTVNTSTGNRSNRDAVYTRSNSAPGPSSGQQLTVPRDATSSSYNAAAANSDEEFWAGRANFERSYQQLEVAAGEVSSTFQNAREQMMDIQHHLQALRRQMEGLQDDLTSTSYTLTPDFSAYDSK